MNCGYRNTILNNIDCWLIHQLLFWLSVQCSFLTWKNSNIMVKFRAGLAKTAHYQRFPSVLSSWHDTNIMKSNLNEFLSTSFFIFFWIKQKSLRFNSVVLAFKLRSKVVLTSNSSNSASSSPVNCSSIMTDYWENRMRIVKPASFRPTRMNCEVTGNESPSSWGWRYMRRQWEEWSLLGVCSSMVGC